ncbi:MAG TPA: Glu/Leu/Phe/Val dehydrogenase dimerization domain-containing protein [Tepidisphaeraceae bacterium]|nr:Glu/Leu/Phe/Val dehydrogenase dimerization domain-containing protein [Tepidisphaeraceae bacterium]
MGASRVDEKIEGALQAVIRRNPGEAEFHRAVRGVLESLGPVPAKHPEFARHKVIERVCEPERQIIFRVPWQDDAGEVQINRGFRVQFTARWARTRAGCGSTRPSTSASSSSSGSSRSSRTR